MSASPRARIAAVLHRLRRLVVASVWRDDVAVGLTAFLLHLPWLRPGGPWARLPGTLPMGQDEGTVLYDSLRIAHGEVMYRDFFQFQGPVFYHLHALLFGLFGPSVTMARFVQLLTSAIATALLYKLVARFAGKAAGLGAALIHACMLVSLWPFAYAHWLTEALGLGALVLLTNEQRRPRHEIAAGALLGLSSFTIQSIGGPMLIAVVFAAGLPGLAARDLGAAFARAARVAAGAGAVMTLIVLYFAVRGAAYDMYYAMFTWTRENYKLGHEPSAGFAFRTEDWIRRHSVFPTPWRSYAGWSLRLTSLLPWFGLIGLGVAMPLGAWRVWKKQAGHDVTLIALAAAAGLAPLWLAPMYPDLTHVAFVGGLGLAGGAVAFHPLVKWARLRRIPVGTILAALLFGVAGTVTALSYGYKVKRTWEWSQKGGTWREEAMRLGKARRLDTLPKDARIMVGDNGGWQYFFVRPAAVGNTYVPAKWTKLFTEKQWQRLADEVVAKKPAAMDLAGKQWSELASRRPELNQLYRADRGLWVLQPPAGAPVAAPAVAPAPRPTAQP